MQFRAAALVGSLLVTTTAPAAVPRTAPAVQADTLTAMAAAQVGKPLRAQRDLRWTQPSPSSGAAWQKLAATGAWRAAWDRATGVPSRIWGSGLPAPGAIAHPDVA